MSLNRCGAARRLEGPRTRGPELATEISKREPVAVPFVTLNIPGPRVRGPSMFEFRKKGSSMFEFRNHFATFCIIFRFFDMNKSCSNPLAAPERRTPCRWAFSLKPNSTMIFLTVCTRHRIPVLAQDPVHDQLRRLWSDPAHWRVGRYVIMPDHCHLLVTVGGSCKVPLPRWISWWKRDVAMKIKSVAWHKNFWDHVVRSEEAFVEFENYMRLNPVRRQLACGEDEWRYQGEVYRLRW